ncbi:endonuclease [Shimia abyssi]|uniref:Trypsin-like peptidase n=1 Tax=Shimia abyssi TaxID=1662395 RepID=A0A2P8FBR5_9RHOB|nr:endonuclease [Shimia abyssi]PSL19134.1 trypsin-like peptidase [Shimia abyssi]
MMDQSEINREAETRLSARSKERARHETQIEAMHAGKAFDWSDLEDVQRLATRARRLGLDREATALLHDPQNKAVGNRIFEKIIDANNLLDTHYLSEGARMSRAIGRVVLPVTGGNRLGTGFMVSPRILMTNNHVLQSELQAGNATIEFDFLKAEDGTTGPVERYRFEPAALFITNVALDFTLVAVEPVNADGTQVGNRGWVPLIGPSGKAVVGERVSILQHPNGEPQKVVLHDNKVTDVNGPFLHYRADTMGGSSGSPVFSINWDLAALHHAAVGTANEGIRISATVAFLREHFAQEAADPTQLLQEVLSSSPAPVAAAGGSDVGGAPTHHANARDDAQPVMNPDGTASWTIPLNITLGIGGLGAAHTPSVAPSPAAPATPPAIVDTGPVDDPDLQAALAAFEATEGQVYYSQVTDDKDRSAYYPDLDALNAAQLYDTLSDLLSRTHTTTLSYKAARHQHLYPWIDRREGPKRDLKGIYSNKVFDTLEVIRNEIAMERAREALTSKRMESLEPIDEAFLEELESSHPFNCEHVVPQSWFNKRKQPKTDMHHLFTCEWGCNSFRSNHAYFDFSTEAFRDNCGESGSGKFEPKHGKGAVARATLYFLLRYPGDIADSTKEMPIDRLSTLIDWAKGDKIDRWELHRNAEIFKVQGNRNPLIDFPDLVDKVDFTRGWA